MAKPTAPIIWRSTPKGVDAFNGLFPASTGIQTSDTAVLYRNGNSNTKLYVSLYPVVS